MATGNQAGYRKLCVMSRLQNLLVNYRKCVKGASEQYFYENSEVLQKLLM